MRCDDKGNTKRLWDFTFIVVLLKNINGFSTCLSKRSKGIHYNDNHIRNNNDNINERKIKTVVVIIMTIIMTVTVII